MCISLLPAVLVSCFQVWFSVTMFVWDAIPVVPKGVMVVPSAFSKGLEAYMAEYVMFMFFMCAALRIFPARSMLAVVVLGLTIFIWGCTGVIKVCGRNAHFDVPMAIETGQLLGVVCTGMFLTAYFLQSLSLGQNVSDILYGGE